MMRVKCRKHPFRKALPIREDSHNMLVCPCVYSASMDTLSGPETKGNSDWEKGEKRALIHSVYFLQLFIQQTLLKRCFSGSYLHSCIHICYICRNIFWNGNLYVLVKFTACKSWPFQTEVEICLLNACKLLKETDPIQTTQSFSHSSLWLLTPSYCGIL